MKKFFILLFMQIAICCTTFATNYLTFTAEEFDYSTFWIVDHNIKSNIFYSLDNGKTWKQLTGKSVKLAKGDRALLKGEEPDKKPSSNSFFSFRMDGAIAASGSVMSLVDGDGESKTIPYDYCFYKLFRGCCLTKAPELPATTLKKECYREMFEACSGLTQTPELPATTLATSCYREMFESCKNLTQAPELPATSLAEDCYYGMFYECESLTQAPELPATTLEKNCYNGMFSFCTSLTQAPELPATTLAEDCYNGMFVWCTSLIQAPELPATTLAPRCYSNMFIRCTSLTQAPELPATTLAEGCYSLMFDGCSSLTQAPKLPATTLAENCYNRMFYECEKLSHIKVAFTDWGTETENWVTNVAETGTFICPEELSLEYGDNFIPEGWTVKQEENTRTEAVATAEILKVHTSGLTIFIRNTDADIEVYEVGGKLIGKARTMNGDAQITVPQSGIYLVKTGAQTFKVAL